MHKSEVKMDYSYFEHLLKLHNTTVYKVAKETKISNSTFTDWKNGRSYPKADKLVRIADYFNISLDGVFGRQLEKSSDIAGYMSVKARKMVPVIGEIRAGSPIITDETLLGYEFADISNVDDYFYLKVRGDSMKDCGIIDGCLVLFHKQAYAESGDIVACLVDGNSATIKRFHQNGKSILLKPENEKYSPLKLSTDDFESGSARILGVAAEVKIVL
jgi:repressor LexA